VNINYNVNANIDRSGVEFEVSERGDNPFWPFLLERYLRCAMALDLTGSRVRDDRSGLDFTWRKR